jgi:hypothetical protein
MDAPAPVAIKAEPRIQGDRQLLVGKCPCGREVVADVTAPGSARAAFCRCGRSIQFDS